MIQDRTSLKTGTKHRRRGYGLLELTLSVILLLAAMMMMVKMLGWVASERRAAERRQWAAQELSNAMERIVSEPFERVTTERASAVLADVPLYQALVSPEWEANVTDDSGSGAPARRVSLRLRWKTRSGEWDSPVRLSAWVYQDKAKGRTGS